MKKALFEYGCRAIPFFAGNSTGAFADYFQGKIAWNDGAHIRVRCLKTGDMVKFNCQLPGQRIQHLKLSDRLVMALTYDG